MSALYGVSAGFDIPIQADFSLAPFLRYMGSTGGSLCLNGSTVGDVNVNQAQFGVALRWHSSNSNTFLHQAWPDGLLPGS